MEHLEGLARELTCSICLSLMERPVARLPCCHYFCLDCITQSVRHKPLCPVCKNRATRRDIGSDDTMDRIVTAFAAVQDHKDVLLGGAMMKEETQYFSPPPSEPQADEEPEAEQPRPGVFAHGTTAATAPGSRPDCARAACVAAEVGVGSVAAEGECRALHLEAPSSRPSMPGEGTRGEVSEDPQQEERLGQEASKRPPGDGLESGDCAKRTKHGAPLETQQAAQDGRDGVAVVEDSERGAPLGWIRGVEDSQWQSPTGSVTSSALEGMFRRGEEMRQEVAAQYGRRLSLPSAHSSPAKRAQRGPSLQLAAEVAALGPGAGEDLIPAPGRIPVDSQGTVTHPSHVDVTPGNVPGGETLEEGPGTGGRIARRGKGRGAVQGRSAAKGGGTSTALCGSQDITKWLALKAPQAGRLQEMGACEEEANAEHAVPGGKDPTLQHQPPAAPAAPEPAPTGPDAVARVVAAPGGVQRLVMPACDGDDEAVPGQRPAGVAPLPEGLEPAAQQLLGSLEGAPALFSPASPSSPGGLSPASVAFRLDSIVQGLEHFQATPAPAQPTAFQTSKVPGPRLTPPPFRQPHGLKAGSSGGKPATAEDFGDGGEAGARDAAGEVKQAGGACPGAEGVHGLTGSSVQARADHAQQGDAQVEAGTQKRPPKQEDRQQGRRSEGEPRLKRSKHSKLAACTPAAGTLARSSDVDAGATPDHPPSRRGGEIAVGGAAAKGTPGTGERGRRVPSRLRQWSCEACTFLNEPQKRKCEMCATPKPPLSRLAVQQRSGAAEDGGVHPASGTPPVELGPGASKRGTCTRKKRGASARPPQPKPRATPDAAPSSLQNSNPNSVSGRATSGVGAGSEGCLPSTAHQGARTDQEEGQVGAAGTAGKHPGGVSQEGVELARRHLAEGVGGSVPAQRPGWEDGRGRAWVLLGSGLGDQGKQVLAELAAAAGGSVAKTWSPAVTHVVCGLVEGAARRTFKLLMGNCGGKWVVGEPWVRACLRTGGPVEEEGFQVVEDSHGVRGGASASRRSVALGLPALLQGYQVFLAGKFSSRDEVVALLRAAGARQLARPPCGPAPSEGPCTSLVMCEAGGDSTAKATPQHAQHGRQAASPDNADQEGGALYTALAGADGARAFIPGVDCISHADEVRKEKWFVRATESGVPVVSSLWLMDSLSSFTVRPLAEYTIKT